MDNVRRMLALSARNLGLTALGVVLYGVTSWVTNIFPFATGVGIEIRPGIAVPVFFGFAFGPVVGFLTGFLGNLLGDTLSGYSSYPPEGMTGALAVVRGFNLNWQVGNGIMGLVPGLAALWYHRYLTGRDQLRALAVTVVAIIAGIGFAAFAEVLMSSEMTVGKAASDYFLPGAQANVLTAIVLVPLLLFNYARLDLRSTDWVHSGLLQRLVLAILISAALPVALLGLFLTQQATGGASGSAAGGLELTVKLLFTVVVTLALAVANASLVALSISKPLLRLTAAAEAMEAGHFTTEQAEELRTTQGKDEVSRLSALFGKMAAEVVRREQSLRQEVQQLRIEIDQTKRAKEVEEVTESEYFRELQTRVLELRRRDPRRNARIAAAADLSKEAPPPASDGPAEQPASTT